MKKRTVDHPSIALTPALHYLLMVGAWADARLHGWVALAMVPLSETDTHVRAAWADHGEALIAEARSFDFEPYQVTRRRPRGPGFDRWQQAFIAEHRY